MFRTLDDRVIVAPQIDVDEIAAAKALGVTLIINNRPDGESPSEPQGSKQRHMMQGSIMLRYRSAMVVSRNRRSMRWRQR
jgi:uncharacterized protein (TIGR01244 family)